MPAHNEAKNIESAVRRIEEYVKIDFECLIVVDDILDTTVPEFEKIQLNPQKFRIVINNLGKGPAFAIRAGVEEADSLVVVITMADGSDDPRDINDLVLLVERGVHVACASRYMATGQQIGAPFLKSCLSRLAGNTLHHFARVKTHDATNSFKAYSLDFLRKVGMESKYGFEVGIEMVAKAHRFGYLVAEIPTVWVERVTGASNFKFRQSIPKYLKWYFFAFGVRRRK